MRSAHALRTLPLTRDCLANREWVAHQHDEEIVDRLTRYFEASHLPCPRIAVTTTSIETALRIVARSDLLMLAPMQLQSFVRTEGLDIAAPEAPIWQYRSGVFFRRSSLKYPIVARLTALLKETIAAHGAGKPESHQVASPLPVDATV